MFKVFHNTKVESNEIQSFTSLQSAMQYIQDETQGLQVLGVNFDEKDTAEQHSYTVYDSSIEDVEEMLDNPAYESPVFYTK